MKGALVLYVLRYVLLTARLHLGDNSRASKVLTIKYLPLLEDPHVCVLEETFCFQQNIFLSPLVHQSVSSRRQTFSCLGDMVVKK